MKNNAVNKELIIGITGYFGSGKSTASRFFQSKGFRSVVLSSFLEEEARRQGAPIITRKILQDIGNEWRKRFGAGILARKALGSSDRHTPLAIDGIRNIAEIEVLRKHTRFILLAVIADRAVRFERSRKITKRGKITNEIFEKLDRRDLGAGQRKAGLHVSACVKSADVTIANNGTIEDFKTKLNRFLGENQIS